MAERLRIKRNSKSSCCVTGCSNTYRNTGEETHFYRFPAAIRFPGRKELWIDAIRNVENGNGKNWTPSLRSLVCSMHFVGGKKSDHPQHPAYVPTIFPAINTSNVKNAPCQILDFQRALKKRWKHLTNLLQEEEDLICASSEPSSKPRFKSVTTSCSLPTNVNFGASLFSCCLYGNDAATQACLSTRPSPQMTGRTVGALDNEECRMVGRRTSQGFQGYKSILTDDHFLDLTGVSKTVFEQLYEMIKPHFNDQSDNVHPMNRLLIFLMKLKLGFPSAALAVMFGVHPMTVSNIFSEVLDILVFQTQCLDYVFWPSRPAVQATLPDVFRKHFPRCRAILDCTEIRIEIPSSVENQLHFYSPYMHCHTVKLMLAMTPSGFISFVSQTYGGHSSNGLVVSDCGILNLLENGDVFIADKEFPLINSKLEDDNAVLVFPPFSSGNRCGPQQKKSMHRVTSVQKHVEKIVQCLKVYKLLDKIEIEQLPNIDKIIRVCCVLINMQSPVIEIQ